MNRRLSRTARTAMVGVAMSVVSVGAAAAASADPVSWLPNADLVCGDTTIHPDEWIAIAPSDTLFVTGTSLAGHYVILSDMHYWMPGYQTAPPPSYDGLEPLASAPRTWGAKQGLRGTAITCDFVSRWGAPGDPATYSVVGPITMARVSR